MIQSLTPAMQKVIAVILALLTLLLLAGLMFLPIFAGSQLQGQTVTVENEIASLQSSLRERENLLAEIRLLERNSERSNAIIDEQSPGTAGASLQGWLRHIIESKGAEVNAAQILDPVDEDEFFRITVRTGFLANINQLRTILHSIESYAPVMIISGFEIDRTDDAIDADINQLLAVSLVVSAYMRPRAEQ